MPSPFRPRSNGVLVSMTRRHGSSPLKQTRLLGRVPTSVLFLAAGLVPQCTDAFRIVCSSGLRAPFWRIESANKAGSYRAQSSPGHNRTLKGDHRRQGHHADELNNNELVRKFYLGL